MLVYLKSVRDVMGDVPVKIENSLNKGLYTEMELAREVSEEDVAAVERRMREIIAADLPIIREVYDRDEAVDIWERYNYEEKAELLREATHVREAEFLQSGGIQELLLRADAAVDGIHKEILDDEIRKGRADKVSAALLAG